MTGPYALALFVLLASGLMTGWVRRYALSHRMVDVPNERSSHSVPTPRGGGLAIAVAVIAGLSAAGLAGWIPFRVTVALVGGGLPVAAIGWIDDRRGMSRGARIAVHLLSAAWAVWWLGGLPSLRAGFVTLTLGAWGAIVVVLGIVWATNLFNFMDGIDGLSGLEAVTVASAGTVMLLLTGHRELASASLVIASASAGFLPWNWSPARIFMGDVGSGLLGFLFGALALASERAGALPAIAWILLLGAFTFDATVTLLLRALRGERWSQAHRSHAYQLAVRSGWSHARVSGAVGVINFVLAAAVWLGYSRPTLRGVLALCAVTGLATLYVWVQRSWSAGGKPDRPEARTPV